MRKLLQISLLGVIAVAISSCSSIKPLDSAGVAKLCTDNGGKLVKNVNKEGDKIISTKISCISKAKHYKGEEIFSYFYGLVYVDWVTIKSAEPCVQAILSGPPGTSPHYERDNLIDLDQSLFTQLRKQIEKKCKLDFSYKMYEKEKDAFNNVNAEVIK